MKYWICLVKSEYIGPCINEERWGVHSGFKPVLEATEIGDKIIFYSVANRTNSDRAFHHGYSFIVGVFEITSKIYNTPQSSKWVKEYPYRVNHKRVGSFNKKIDLGYLSYVLGIAERDLRARLVGEDMIEINNESFEKLCNYDVQKNS